MTESLEGWPVLPQGVEGVLLFTLPPGPDPEPRDCYICGTPVLDGMAFGDPVRGIAHAACWDRESLDS